MIDDKLPFEQLRVRVHGTIFVAQPYSGTQRFGRPLLIDLQSGVQPHVPQAAQEPLVPCVGSAWHAHCISSADVLDAWWVSACFHHHSATWAAHFMCRRSCHAAASTAPRCLALTGACQQQHIPTCITSAYMRRQHRARHQDGRPQQRLPVSVRNTGCSEAPHRCRGPCSHRGTICHRRQRPHNLSSAQSQDSYSKRQAAGRQRRQAVRCRFCAHLLL